MALSFLSLLTKRNLARDLVSQWLVCSTKTFNSVFMFQRQKKNSPALLCWDTAVDEWPARLFCFFWPIVSWCHVRRDVDQHERLMRRAGHPIIKQVARWKVEKWIIFINIMSSRLVDITTQPRDPNTLCLVQGRLFYLDILVQEYWLVDVLHKTTLRCTLFFKTFSEMRKAHKPSGRSELTNFGLFYFIF